MRHVRADLASEGVRFASAYATAPECCPSRATLLTGQHPHNHRVLSNEPPDGGFDAFRDRETLPVWLREAGYRTGYVGKYLNGYGWAALGNDPAYVPPGWSQWSALVNHTEYRMYEYDLNVGGRIVHYGSEPPDYQTDVLATRARRFVSTSLSGERPFFLTVAPLAPHDEGVLEGLDVARNPRPAPRHAGSLEDLALPRGPAFNEPEIADKPSSVAEREPLGADETAAIELLRRSRLESLLAVDELVHGLVEVLRDAGELEETTFVFTSDNGFLLGEHRLVGKERVYEEASGVPLIIRGPGFEPGRVETTPVSNVDLVATILDQSGAEPGLPQDGFSLAGGADEIAARPPVLFGLPAERPFAALRSGDHVYAEHKGGEVELYDLAADPHQLENLAGDPALAETQSELARTLAGLRRCSGASCLGGADD